MFNGTITNDLRAEIINISKPSGLPGDIIFVKVKFKKPEIDIAAPLGRTFYYPDLQVAPGATPVPFRFRLDWGGEGALQSDIHVEEDIEYSQIPTQLKYLGTDVNYVGGFFNGKPVFHEFSLDRDVIIDFTIRVPDKEPGIYKLWTSAGWPNAPVKTKDFNGNEFPESNVVPSLIPRSVRATDPESEANVLFFIESVDTVIVERKNLYAPQLKAATVVGDKLIGIRTFEGVGFLEVYQEQNEEIDRTLQISFSDAALGVTNPTYAEIIGYNGIIIAGLDNIVYKIDIETDGLTAQQRFTKIGQVPGTYVSGLAIWNQRVYGGSFDKSLFESSIWWTNLEEIQGSYNIDGKFWITDLANFQGGLFYSGGTQDGIGEVRGYPSVPILDIEHPVFDAKIRSLNAGRILYMGLPHLTGLGAITREGASSWARKDLGDAATNVVWDTEEVGSNVFLITASAIYKTNNKFISEGFLETSKFGGATPLIDKIWNEIRIEAKELDDSHKIRVLATHSLKKEEEFIIIGEMTSADGLEKIFKLPDDFKSQWMKVRLELSTEDPASTPIIKRVMTKYVPNALQKWQWVFTIRATESIKMISGKKQSKSGQQLLEEIEDLVSGGPINFRDVDNKKFETILTDMKIVRPIQNPKDEAMVSMELLET